MSFRVIPRCAESASSSSSWPENDTTGPNKGHIFLSFFSFNIMRSRYYGVIRSFSGAFEKQRGLLFMYSILNIFSSILVCCGFDSSIYRRPGWMSLDVYRQWWRLRRAKLVPDQNGYFIVLTAPACAIVRALHCLRRDSLKNILTSPCVVSNVKSKNTWTVFWISLYFASWRGGSTIL